MRTMTMLALGAVALLLLVAGEAPRPVRAASPASVADTCQKLPLAFEINRGQYASGLDFLAQGADYSLSLTSTEAVFTLEPGQTVGVRLVDSNPVAMAIAEEPLRELVNVPTFGKARYRSVYPGIDLVYRGNQQRLEYHFMVRPGSDPSRVSLTFPGTDSLRVAEDGGLVLGLAGRELRWDAPVVYQTVEGQRKTVEGAYRLVHPDAPSSVPAAAFSLGAYDPRLPLAIDPVLVYSTIPGGAGRREETRADGRALRSSRSRTGTDII